MRQHSEIDDTTTVVPTRQPEQAGRASTDLTRVDAGDLLKSPPERSRRAPPNTAVP
jgi:hypothetical protein